MIVFEDFDLSGFWSGDAYERKNYISRKLDESLLRSVEQELGVKLPESYVEMMKVQNGGTPSKNSHPTNTPTSWAKDHIAISGIYGIDRKLDCSLCGYFSTKFWMGEWGYPHIGVYFADCPSAGHDMLCLDYRNASGNSQPTVVHVDQENDYRITFIAPDFESFIRGLKDENEFELD
ncbi:SMI1/KNR4 family protein [Ruegeria arenilitoris]|uniref:SMI1/KNR4 family protein n=1 Tax=Ruegeria arenilitoris TaxID=1173585 RepID=UPI00147F9D4A|nr:SMI1/KNR4 family protein [Ruegeria arenilitoris]